MSNYKVLKDVDSTFTDISLITRDFTDNSTLLPLASTDYLYVGYYKKFTQFFMEFAVANIVTNTLTIEYFNGTSWVDLTNVEETEGFTKSGFVNFTRPDDWEANTVNLEEQFWIRLQPSEDLTAETALQGLGILLSNDQDLIEVKSNIVSKLNNGLSWVGKHELARKRIIQKLRNLGYRKYKTNEENPLLLEDEGSTLYYSNLTEFDLLDPSELREASKYYALAFIYLDELSDEQDDKWERSGLRHELRGDEAVGVFSLRIDSNDDGEEDAEENEGNTGTNLTWA